MKRFLPCEIEPCGKTTGFDAPPETDAWIVCTIGMLTSITLVQYSPSLKRQIYFTWYFIGVYTSNALTIFTRRHLHSVLGSKAWTRNRMHPLKVSVRCTPLKWQTSHSTDTLTGIRYPLLSVSNISLSLLGAAVSMTWAQRREYMWSELSCGTSYEYGFTACPRKMRRNLTSSSVLARLVFSIYVSPVGQSRHSHVLDACYSAYSRTLGWSTLDFSSYVDDFNSIC